MAAGTACRLVRSGFRVLLTEIKSPLAVRRAVAFSEAVYDGSAEVEGITAILISSVDRVEQIWSEGLVPVLVDPDLTCLSEFQPDVIIDAILAKRNTGLNRRMARLTIGLGPGFRAPDDVHLAIETNRGHNLGRLIYNGEPEPNTGAPGNIAGCTVQRVLRAPSAGPFQPVCELGSLVDAGQVIGTVNGRGVVYSGVGGVLRGLIRPGVMVEAGEKLGDVDPRSDPTYLSAVSEKARAIGGSVLEGIMAEFQGRYLMNTLKKRDG